MDGYSNNNTFRTFVKRMLLITVNADGREKTRAALQEEVVFKKTLELPSEIESTKKEHLYPLMDAFEMKHEKIKKYFSTGVGIDLQYLDSQIAEKVLLSLSRSHRPVLPLHDSFVVHHHDEERLKEEMAIAFKDLFGVDTKIDLKYNSILKRREGKRREGKREEWRPEDDVCDLSLQELLAENAKSSIYHKQLEAHWRRK